MLEAGDKTASPEPWEVAAWVLRVGPWCRNALDVAGMVIAFFLALGGWGSFGANHELWAFVFVPAVFLAAIVLHEAGHIAAARAAGMKPVVLQVGRLALVNRRRGWVLRKGFARKGLAGYAMAFANPARSLRRSSSLMILGGPLANLVCASCFLGLFALFGHGGPGTLCLCAATINGVLGLGSLIPTLRTHPSDGLMLLFWLRGFPEDHPTTIFARLMGKSLFGQTADELPAQEIDLLEKQGPDSAIIADWFRLKAAQNRGQWPSAAGMREAFERKIESAPEELKQALRTHIAAHDAEIRFSEAMAARDVRLLPAPETLLPLRADVPYLLSRVDALRCALSGDAEGARAACMHAGRLAHMGIDDALIRSEAMIAGSILQLLAAPESVNPPFAAPAVLPA